MAGHLVRNVSPMMHGASLCTKDASTGHPCTLRLRPGETSRELTEDEFRSAEVQRLVEKKLFVDVTGFAERQRLAREAHGQPGR